MIRSIRRRRHELCSAWSESHRMVDAHSRSLFFVENLKQMNRGAVHFQRMHLCIGQNTAHVVSNELMLQSERLCAGSQLVERIENMRVENGNYEMLIKGEG